MKPVDAKEQEWVDRYAGLLTAELAGRGVDVPARQVASVVRTNVILVAALSGISDRDARLTINPDAVSVWADLLGGLAEDDEPCEELVRIPMATAAKACAALAQCRIALEVLLDVARDNRTFAADPGPGRVLALVPDTARADRLTALRAEADRVEVLSARLAMVLGAAPHTAGDVVVTESLLDAMLDMLAQFQDRGHGESFDDNLPGWFCRDRREATAGAAGCDDPGHTLTALIDRTLGELDAAHDYVDTD